MASALVSCPVLNVEVILSQVFQPASQLTFRLFEVKTPGETAMISLQQELPAQ